MTHHADVSVVLKSKVLDPRYLRYEGFQSAAPTADAPAPPNSAAANTRSRPRRSVHELCAAKLVAAMKKSFVDAGHSFKPNASHAIRIHDSQTKGGCASKMTGFWLLSLTHYSQVWAAKASTFESAATSGVDHGLGSISIDIPFQIWPLHFVAQSLHEELVDPTAEPQRLDSSDAQFSLVELHWDCDSMRAATIIECSEMFKFSRVCRCGCGDLKVWVWGVGAWGGFVRAPCNATRDTQRHSPGAGVQGEMIAMMIMLFFKLSSNRCRARRHGTTMMVRAVLTSSKMA